MKNFPIEKFKNQETPFYFYNKNLLNKTLQVVVSEANKYGYHIHYAIKANSNPKLLALIKEQGLGADCVSGGEIEIALKCGFPTEKIMFAGVGKSDQEIDFGLKKEIFCFNVESVPELEVINQLASQKNKKATIALRINPDIDSHTHKYITTGTKENKFGINIDQLNSVLNNIKGLQSIKLIGLHFHIGSQLTDLTPFILLCQRANELQQYCLEKNILFEHINFGGGLGISYEHPHQYPIPNFKDYFKTFYTHFNVLNHQQVHFELGRSIVGQCGSLISKVLYVKHGSTKKFIVLDAGFTDLIRPAFYQSYHCIENISSSINNSEELYDIVGPICESSDYFARQRMIKKTHRGDLVAILSAGAYGEVMASQYNCRKLPKSYF